jgi:hypothetical protein
METDNRERTPYFSNTACIHYYFSDARAGKKEALRERRAPTNDPIHNCANNYLIT